jgi:hypothetical protein
MRTYTLAAVMALATLYTTASTAQTITNTTAVSSPSSSSLIPTTGVSSACTSFLNTLNNDTAIQACTAPLLSATQFYTNASAAAKNSTAANTTSSADALTSSLSQLCASNTGCNSSLIRQYLSQFWTACDTELRAENSQILAIYDVLYLLNPFHQAVCTRDDTNDYCVLNIASDTATESSTTPSKRSMFDEDGQIRKRQAVASSAVSGAELSSSNIAFLFLQTTSDKAVMCSSCAKNVMASYISFETSIPYAIGLANSGILGNQANLYNTMAKTCGNDFTTAINAAAGTTAFTTVSGASSRATIGTAATIVVASIAAVVLSL